MSSTVEIPLQEILLATNNFAKENLIAFGGYGPVYEGKSEKHGMIAVKRLDRKNGQGDVEFRREIALLSEYKHENIVSLLGFCDENDDKILVYRLESNGSLDKHLNNKDLSWIQRLRICLDAARGLKYLHDDVGPQQRILHRDVKSANILLDENWNAKISDFGLSRIGPANMHTTLLISNACGTFGYIDPEYLYTGCLTQRSDVYSFGVVLFEVLCGRPTRITCYTDERQFLTVLVNKHYARQKLDEIIPFYLLNQINEASLDTFLTTAYQCLKNGIERPTMNNVVQQLQKALDDQLVSYCSRKPSNVITKYSTQVTGSVPVFWVPKPLRTEKEKKIHWISCLGFRASRKHRAAAISKPFKFLPSDYHESIARAVSNVVFDSDSYILLDRGTLGFKLDKESGKKCYMLAARYLSIAWHKDTRYWEWGHIPESRFAEVGILRGVWWLDIRGIIATAMLSPKTTYVAYLVFGITRRSSGLDEPARTIVTFGGIRNETSNVYLQQRGTTAQTQVSHTTRKDGWMEIALGEFYRDDVDEGEVEMAFENHVRLKTGLIVEGIEVRPK